jgi:hypothetical protein
VVEAGAEAGGDQHLNLAGTSGSSGEEEIAQFHHPRICIFRFYFCLTEENTIPLFLKTKGWFPNWAGLGQKAAVHHVTSQKAS